MCLYITFEMLRASRGFLNSCSAYPWIPYIYSFKYLRNPITVILSSTQLIREETLFFWIWTGLLNLWKECVVKNPSGAILCYIQIRGGSLWKIHPRSVPVPFWGTPHPIFPPTLGVSVAVHFISDLVAAKSLDAELMRTYYSAPRSIRLGPRSGVVVPQGVTWTDVARRFGAKPAEVQQDPLGTWLIFSWNSRWNLGSVHKMVSRRYCIYEYLVYMRPPKSIHSKMSSLGMIHRSHLKSL